MTKSETFIMVTKSVNKHYLLLKYISNNLSYLQNKKKQYKFTSYQKGNSWERCNDYKTFYYEML